MVRMQASIWQRLQVRLRWSGRRLESDGVPRTQLDDFEANLAYGLRLLNIEAGYRRYDQEFLSFAGLSSGRNQIFFRVSRKFAIF
jgi:hypothetical protein